MVECNLSKYYMGILGYFGKLKVLLLISYGRHVRSLGWLGSVVICCNLQYHTMCTSHIILTGTLSTHERAQLYVKFHVRLRFHKNSTDVP